MTQSSSCIETLLWASRLIWLAQGHCSIWSSYGFLGNSPQRRWSVKDKPMTTSQTASEIKAGLYDEYNKGQEWKRSLQRKVTHKALDIPDDDVDINVNNSTTNSGRALLLAVLAGALGAGGPMLGYLLSRPATNVAPQTQPADTTANVGLGHIDDYLGKNGQP